MAESSSQSSSSSSSPTSSTVSTSGPPKKVQNSATSNVDDTPEEEDLEEEDMAEVGGTSGNRPKAADNPTVVGPASGNLNPEEVQSQKQKIRASTQDNTLEPDAMRGSEHHLQDVDFENEEEARRDAYRSDEEKQQRQDDMKRQQETRERRAKARENQ